MGNFTGNERERERGRSDTNTDFRKTECEDETKSGLPSYQRFAKSQRMTEDEKTVIVRH